MWVAVHLAKDHSAWTELSTAGDVEQLKNLELDPSNGEVYYFWGGEYPSEPEALQALYDQMVEANGGIELSLHVGAAVAPLAGMATSNGCSGHLCFCTVSGGSRRCEVCWQGPNGAVCTGCSGSC